MSLLLEDSQDLYEGATSKQVVAEGTCLSNESFRLPLFDESQLSQLLDADG